MRVGRYHISGRSLMVEINTPIATMVLQMISAGIPPEVIALAVQTAELAARESATSSVPIDIAAQKRREWDRNRKRAAKNNSTGNSAMDKKPPLIGLDKIVNEIPKVSKKELVSEKQNSTGGPPEIHRKRIKGVVCGEDFVPDDTDYKHALTLGMPREFADRCAIEMREWSGANSHREVARKTDWHLALKGWMRRESGKQKGTNGHGQTIGAAGSNSGGRSASTGSDAILTGMGKVANRVAARRMAERSGGSGSLPLNDDPTAREYAEYLAKE